MIGKLTNMVKRNCRSVIACLQLAAHAGLVLAQPGRMALPVICDTGSGVLKAGFAGPRLFAGRILQPNLDGNYHSFGVQSNDHTPQQLLS